MIHVLASDIPHHNATVLRFFNDVLAPEHRDARVFWVAAADPSALGEHSALQVVAYLDRQALARALIALARRNRGQRFFLHGQFSPRIWLALLTGSIRADQVHWHIWGADLYETSTRSRHRLYYRLRRIAQGRVGRVYGTLGDIERYRARHPRTPASQLYFPTRMPRTSPTPPAKATSRAPFTVLIGNSGDRSNRHADALRAVHRQFGPRTRVVLPLGYPCGNEAYTRQVRAEAHRLFPPDNVSLLTCSLGFEQYDDLIAQCDLGYFTFRRQQGIGTLCLLMRRGVPFVISKDNPFARDLADQGVPVLIHGDPLDEARVARTGRQLAGLDLTQIAFFPDNCVPGWQRALAEGATDVRR